MPSQADFEHIETVIIGAGQAGLSAGYHLARRGRPFVILERNDRIGEQWRNRWDSLRLFTPAKFDGLPGMRFPAPGDYFPTKDEMADYLEAYAAWFELPVRLGVEVDRVARLGSPNNGSDRRGGFLVSAGDARFEADNVVIAMANFQKPSIPGYAADLDPAIRQIHSFDYRNPDQLQDGAVLIVGAGNSGAEIAMDVGRGRTTWVSGRNVGQVPFPIDGFLGRKLLVRLVLRGVYHRVLTVDTPMGRKARPQALSQSGPLVRTKRKHITELGVDFVPRVSGVRDGQPLLEDGRALDVANVIWCTGYQPGFDWIELPVFGETEPLHERGIVASQPGLYFLGLHFLYSYSSVMIHGVGRDADRIAGEIARRANATQRADVPRAGDPVGTAA